MFCPRCGAQNEAGAVSCLRCGTDLPKPRPVGTSESNRETSTMGDPPSAVKPPTPEPPAPGTPPAFDDSPQYPPPPGQSFPPPPAGSQGYGNQPPYGGGPGYSGGQGYGGAPSGWTPGSGQQTYGSQPPYGSGPGYQIGNTPSYGSPNYGGASAGGNVPNYLVWSIVTTLLCCLPAGVVAIVYSSQVNSKLQNGDYAGAVEASNKAKMWCFISAGLSIVAIVISILLSIANN